MLFLQNFDNKSNSKLWLIRVSRARNLNICSMRIKHRQLLLLSRVLKDSRIRAGYLHRKAVLLESVPTEISNPSHPSHPTYSFWAFKPFYGGLKEPKQTKADQCRPMQTKAGINFAKFSKISKISKFSKFFPNFRNFFLNFSKFSKFSKIFKNFQNFQNFPKNSNFTKFPEFSKRKSKFSKF